jgi:hypothetical protein
MSFGLRNAAQTFQRFMDGVLMDSTSLSPTWTTSLSFPGHSKSTTNT